MTGVVSTLNSIVQITYIVGVVLALVAGISLLVSILMIVATTYMSVTERTKEIGVLRAMGLVAKIFAGSLSMKVFCWACPPIF